MIHQYKLNGYNIVLDTFSGSIHSVDDVCYDVIEMFESCPKQQIIDELSAKYNLDKSEIAECIDDVNELKSQGKLFAEDTFSPIATAFKQKSGNVIKALCLHVAHTCNLNCSYCFASQVPRRARSDEFRSRQASVGLPNYQLGNAPQPRSGFLRGRAVNELASGKRPCTLRPLG